MKINRYFGTTLISTKGKKGMGTRNVTIIVSDKKVKVAQYGQFDGYYEGLGKKLLETIRVTDMGKLKTQLSKCKFANDEEVEAIENWENTHPQFGRSFTGKELVNYIINSKTDIHLINSEYFIADGLFCEYVYVLDMDKEVFEAYEGYNKKEVGVRNRFKAMSNPAKYGGYHPPKKTFQTKFNEIQGYSDEILDKFGNVSMRDFKKAIKLEKFVEECQPPKLK
jgi:hypothetical protein